MQCFPENEIASAVQCPFCKQIFTEPFVLPCGNSICGNCVEKHDIGGKKAMNCVCMSEHVFEYDWPENLVLMNILKIEPIIANRGELKINDVDSLKGKLKDDMEQADLNVRNFFEILRNKVVLKSESLIEVIHNQREELFKQINEEEKKIVKSCRNLLDFKNISLECKIKLNDWLCAVDKQKPSVDSELKVILKQIADFKPLFDYYETKLNDTILSEKKLRLFDKIQTGENLLGKLVHFKSIRLIF